MTSVRHPSVSLWLVPISLSHDPILSHFDLGTFSSVNVYVGYTVVATFLSCGNSLSLVLCVDDGQVLCVDDEQVLCVDEGQVLCVDDGQVLCVDDGQVLCVDDGQVLCVDDGQVLCVDDGQANNSSAGGRTLGSIGVVRKHVRAKAGSSLASYAFCVVFVLCQGVVPFFHCIVGIEDCYSHA